MADGKVSSCFDLRTMCLLIGYWNLVVITVDIMLQLVVTAIVSDGFQCDVTSYTVERVDWTWLGSILMVLNLGTNGFYAFLMTLWYSGPLPQTRKCYPGMIHVYLIDLLIVIINVIWMKFVVAFISSIHKKDAGPIRMFLHLCLGKLLLQIVYLSYGPPMKNISWLIKICDVAVATGIILIVNSYINLLRKEKDDEIADNPPTFEDAMMEAKKPLDDVTDQHRLDNIAVDKPLDDVTNQSCLENIAVVCDVKPAEKNDQVKQ